MSKLPEGWAEAKIRDTVGDFETIDPKKAPEQMFFYVDIGAIDNSIQEITAPKEFLGREAPSRARRVIKANDVLFSTVRTYLKNVAQVPERLDGQLTSTGICVLRANEITDPGYLFRWVSSSNFIDEISEAQDGTMYPAVRDEDVLSGPIPLPPLPEQRRIVRKLDTLSARTTTARTHLTAIAKLVDRYKLAVLARIFENLDCLSDELRSLTSLVTSGSRGWAKYYSDDGPLFIRVGDTRRGSPILDLGDAQHVRPPADGEGKRTKLQAGDLVISITADLGRVGVVPAGIGEAYVNQHIALVRPTAVESAQFIAWYLISPLGQAQLFENDRGATKAGLGLDDIRDVRIPRCKRDEQREIVRQIETAFAKIDCLAAEAEKALKVIGRLDQRILAKAFSGELVPQDPNDEPASALLDRIREARANASKPKRQTRKPQTMKKKSNLASLLND